MRIAITSRKSVIVACTPVTVVFRSSVMSLIITFMFEPAKLQMNCASASGARKARREATEDAEGVLTGVILRRGRTRTSSYSGDARDARALIGSRHEPGTRL